MKPHRESSEVGKDPVSGSSLFERRDQNSKLQGELQNLPGEAWVDKWVGAVLAKKVALHHWEDRCVAGAIVEQAQGPALCITIQNTTSGGEISSVFSMRKEDHKDPAVIRRYLVGATLTAERNW